MEIINGEYVLDEEESYNLLHNKVNRLNPYDEKIQSFIDNIDIEFVDGIIIVNIPEEEKEKNMKLNDIVYLKITPEIKDFCSNLDLEGYDYIAAKVYEIVTYNNEEICSFYLGLCGYNPGLYYVVPMKSIEDTICYTYPKRSIGKVYDQNLIDSGDIGVIKLTNDNASYTIHNPKTVAEITLCGSIHFTIDDSMSFIKPTPEQIKNLHDILCIDVELFD